MKRRAFTLVELLVVIGIIAVLMGILLPVMGKVRESSRQTVCAGQLRDIGNMYQMYLNEHKGRVARVNPLPSDPNLVPGAPSIVEVLQPYCKGSTAVFHCPSDRIINGSGGNFDSYYAREGTSYEYNVHFNAFAYDEKTGINKVWRDALKDAEDALGITPDRLIIFTDFDPFHGKPGELKSKNALYADFHAGPRTIQRMHR